MLQVYLSILADEFSKRKFEDLYIDYKQFMYSVAFSILKNVYDSEDAVHQAFLTIANNFERVSELSCQDLKPYIAIIVKNISINIYNKNKRNADRYSELNEEILSVEVDFFENYNYESLLKAIFELNEIYKDVLYLRYVIGFSSKEISKMLDVSEDVIWKRTERAKKQLKKLLEEGERN
jgi:RNA polymerase sigma-70 factor (ECF subfamily)